MTANPVVSSSREIELAERLCASGLNVRVQLQLHQAPLAGTWLTLCLVISALYARLKEKEKPSYDHSFTPAFGKLHP
jgi:hypothetical protein